MKTSRKAKKRYLLATFLLAEMLAGCSAPTPEPTLTPTVFSRMEITTATPVTPTATQTETPTETPTITPTLPSPTETPTETATLDPNVTVIATEVLVEKPKISPRSDTNCRKSPNKEAEVIGFFIRGQTAEVLAKDQYGIWLLIDNPTTEDDPNCWVWSGNVDLTGDLSQVPVFSMK